MENSEIFETNTGPTPSKLNQEKESRMVWLERFLGHFDAIRLWLTKAWRIGILMAKGGYLLSERRKLFQRLGESVYFKIKKGEFGNAELEPLVQQLDKLTKKVEIEELLIRGVRFGKAEKHRYAKEGEQEARILE